MKKLAENLGKLAKLKNLNRDQLAQKVGWDKPNMLKAFAGERPLPSRYISGLRKELGLDDTYRFVQDVIHCLTVSGGETQAAMVVDVFRQFLPQPIQNRWLLRGIPEAGGEGLAYVLEDSQGTLIVVRNDDALLLCPEQWENAQEDAAAAVAAIFDRSQAMEREVPMPLFERIFAGDMTVTEARAMLNREAKVWTWSRIADRAKREGWGADVVAERLGLSDKLHV